MEESLISKAFKKHARSVGYTYHIKADTLCLRGVSTFVSHLMSNSFYLEMFGLLNENSVTLWKFDNGPQLGSPAIEITIPFSDPQLFTKIENHFKKYKKAFKRFLKEIINTHSVRTTRLKEVYDKL